MDCLCSRAGFDDWYYDLDDDTQEEIDRELYSLIKRRIEESQRKKKK